MHKKAISITIWFIVLAFTVLFVFLSFFLMSLTINASQSRNSALSIAQTSSLTSLSQGLEGRVIILDPGHGAGNTNTFEGYDEQVRMLALANKIKPLLEERGATVLMTRPSETDVILPVRTALINKWALETIREVRQEELTELEELFEAGAISSEQGLHRLRRDVRELDRLIGIMQRIIDNPDSYAGVYFNFPFDTTHTRQIHSDLRRVFELKTDPVIRDNFLMISLHSNATPRPINTRINGADSFFISNNLRNNTNYFANYANVQRSSYFANLIITNIDPLGIRRNRASARNLFMIREINMPSVLVENGFHTNPIDRARLQDDDFLSRLAVVYADTITAYFANLENIHDRPIDNLDETFGAMRLM